MSWIASVRSRVTPFVLTLGAIAVVGLAVRLVFTLAIAPDLVAHADPRTYHFLGNNLADGLGYIRPPQLATDASARVATAEFPPLFPAFVAVSSLFGARSITTQAVATCFLGAGTVVFVGLLGRRFAGRTVGLLAAAVVALHPLLFQADGVLMAESLYLFLVSALLLAALAARDDPTPWWRWVLLGALTGLAALTRTEALLFVPILLIPLALGRMGAQVRRRAVATVLVCGAAAAVVVPWTVRNAITFDRFVPVSTNVGTVTLGANCGDAYHGRQLGSWAYACVELTAAIEGKRDAFRRGGPSEAEVYDHYRSLGTDYARDHLGSVPKVLAVRLLRTWGLWNPSNQIDFDVGERRDRTLQMIGYVLEWLLLPLAALGAWMWRRRAVLVLLTPAVVACVTTVVGFGSTRTRTVAEPAIAVLAAAGLVWLVNRRSRDAQGADGASARDATSTRTSPLR